MKRFLLGLTFGLSLVAWQGDAIGQGKSLPRNPGEADRDNQARELTGRTDSNLSKSTAGPLDRRIQELISQLGSPSYQVRRIAETELSRIGLPAFEHLRRACFHANVQIAETATYLLKSQTVTWWLESDPTSVQQLLQDFNTSSPVDRETTFQRLANLKSIEANLALIRIARYEFSELTSKGAALALLKGLAEPTVAPAELRKEHTQKMLASIGDSDRVACQWLANALNDPPVDAETWNKLADSEYQLYRRKRGDTSKKIVLGLYRWIGLQLTEHGLRTDALRIVRPSLDLVAKRDMDLRESALWAIDAKLPELVEELAKLHAGVFEKQADLRYLLAESYLRRGDQALAERTAQSASECVKTGLESARAIKINDDLMADTRRNLGEYLQERGLFAWAEMEYAKGLELSLTTSKEFIHRVTFAEFYSEGEEYEKAAEVLNAFLKKIESMPDEMEKLRREVALAIYDDAESDLKGARGSYHYFQGMAALRDGAMAKAREQLELAVENYPSNPDIVIALSKTVNKSQEDSYFDTRFKKLVDEFQQEILEREQRLGERGLDQQSEQILLANACNQLAWLLSKTEQQPAEAVRLSKRSLELKPDEAIYLDTLGRCYFAAGEIELAIETQQEAVRLAPFHRSMIRQLEEFKAARKSSGANTQSDRK